MNPKIILLFLMINILANAQTKNLKLLFIGDSYTIGESVIKVESYPYQLITLMSDKNFKVTDFKVVAQTGWSTTQLIEGLKNVKVNYDYDYCFLCIGVNNQYRKIDFQIFENEIVTLINYGKARSKNVVLLSIPNYGYTPFGNEKKQEISKELKKYNSEIKSKSKELKTKYVSITEISEKNIVKLVAEDNLHPSAFQYSLWVELIYNKLFGNE